MNSKIRALHGALIFEQATLKHLRIETAHWLFFDADYFNIARAEKALFFLSIQEKTGPHAVRPLATLTRYPSNRS